MSRPTQDADIPDKRLRVRACHPLRNGFPAGFPFPFTENIRRSYNPAPAWTGTVWAAPRSIATTGGITVVFFSSGYLDVSVRRVGFPIIGMKALQTSGLPHSETRGYSGYLLLPAAYRSLSRPSSPPRAKASAVRPCLLSRVSLSY